MVGMLVEIPRRSRTFNASSSCGINHECLNFNFSIAQSLNCDSIIADLVACSHKAHMRISHTLTKYFHTNLEGGAMNSVKTFVVAMITASAIATIVPVVGAQESNGATSALTSSRSSVRAANRQLAKHVQTALYRQKSLDSTDLHAVARNGKITLVGMTSNQEQIDLAGRIAACSPNQIQI